LKANKPVHREKYPYECRTWGDWVRTRRIDLRLTKAQLSVNLHVDDTTIYLWEKNKIQPSPSQIPKIIEFLGHDPLKKRTEKLGDKIREYRRVHGLTQRKLAEQLGIDKTTVGYLERGEHQPTKNLLEKIKSVLIL
jgi:transcriptional regulator with XRE-family HTH domain